MELKYPDFTPCGVVWFGLVGFYFTVSTILFQQVYFITWHVQTAVALQTQAHIILKNIPDVKMTYVVS